MHTLTHTGTNPQWVKRKAQRRAQLSQVSGLERGPVLPGWLTAELPMHPWDGLHLELSLHVLPGMLSGKLLPDLLHPQSCQAARAEAVEEEPTEVAE